jgi:hypothetical protein
MSGPGPALFDFGPPRAAPTTVERLDALAARVDRLSRARRARSRREEDRAVMDRLHAIGLDLASRFRLAWKALEAEAEGVNGHYGICYRDGTIRIRLRHAKTGRMLKESSLVDTLCHELAHLRHFDHSERFRRFHRRIQDEARRLGYYRPRSGEKPAGPRQRSLFDDRTCFLLPEATKETRAT